MLRSESFPICVLNLSIPWNLNPSEYIVLWHSERFMIWKIGLSGEILRKHLWVGKFRKRCDFLPIVEYVSFDLFVITALCRLWGLCRYTSDGISLCGTDSIYYIVFYLILNSYENIMAWCSVLGCGFSFWRAKDFMALGSVLS